MTVSRTKVSTRSARRRLRSVGQVVNIWWVFQLCLAGHLQAHSGKCRNEGQAEPSGTGPCQAPLAAGKERITVTALNYEDATHLQVPIGSPAARVTRVFLSAEEQIVFLGQNLYRAERFSVDRDITTLLNGGEDAAAGSSTGSSRTPEGRRLAHRRPGAVSAAPKSGARARA
ncbi:UTRA domain-containing protein [Variovorax rhizosphaerae]|uniref:UTRA domain-containing protein n=1 Tax=Variovorax rhizosphaerae TaxID=1836200 RepID=A0ABU8WUM2_9BURK